MVIAWTKQAGAKGDFRHEPQMGHAIAHPRLLCIGKICAKKKMWFMAAFLLHDFADLRFTNPTRMNQKLY